MVEPTRMIEAQVLGALLEDPSRIPEIITQLNESDFADRPNQILFEIIKGMHAAELTIDLGEVMVPCNQKGIAGHPIYCVDECQKLVAGFNIEKKIALIKAEAVKRYAGSEAERLIKEIASGKLDSVDSISGRFADVAKSILARSSETNERDISRLIRDALNYGARQRQDLVYFGLEPVDVMLKGFEPGEMITVVARTGIGKSAIALDPLLKTGLAGRWSMFVSTEMPSEQVMLRAVSKVSGVPISSIKMERGYEITPDQSRMVTDAIALLDKSKLLFFDQIRTIGQIEAEIMKQKHLGNPVRLLVVDYIQQLRADKSKSSRQEEISDISNRLMSLAIRERMTVIVCAQFNRTSDPYGKPELSQIKDCGSIEQDSSRVIALTKDRTDPKLTYFHILKNRGGEQGETRLTFYGSNMRFYPYRPGG